MKPYAVSLKIGQKHYSIGGDFDKPKVDHQVTTKEIRIEKPVEQHVEEQEPVVKLEPVVTV